MASNRWKKHYYGKMKYNPDEFLRVKPDCKLKVRLIGKPVEIINLFSNKQKCIVLDNKFTGQHLKAKFPDLVNNVSVRYACWCIDRDDDSLKILDMPISLARVFGNRELLVGKRMAGDKDGCDWKISTNGKKGFDVRYEAVYIEETPLSKAEKQMITNRRANKNKHFNLTKIFKSCSFKEAEEKLLY